MHLKGGGGMYSTPQSSIPAPNRTEAMSQDFTFQRGSSLRLGSPYPHTLPL